MSHTLRVRTTPLPRLIHYLDALVNTKLDAQSLNFSAQFFANHTIDVGNPSNNVIPAVERPVQHPVFRHLVP